MYCESINFPSARSSNRRRGWWVRRDESDDIVQSIHLLLSHIVVWTSFFFQSWLRKRMCVNQTVSEPSEHQLRFDLSWCCNWRTTTYLSCCSNWRKVDFNHTSKSTQCVCVTYVVTVLLSLTKTLIIPVHELKWVCKVNSWSIRTYCGTMWSSFRLRSSSSFFF